MVIVALTVLFSLRYMILTRRSLSHPRSSFGRGLMIATGLFACLHFINIGTHVSTPYHSMPMSHVQNVPAGNQTSTVSIDVLVSQSSC